MSGIWHSFESAPRDGTWIMALQNDWKIAHRVSWGSDRTGAMAWCGPERSFLSYGDGLFCMWAIAPLTPERP